MFFLMLSSHVTKILFYRLRFGDFLTTFSHRFLLTNQGQILKNAARAHLGWPIETIGSKLSNYQNPVKSVWTVF